MPRIWMDYCSFLVDQKRITRTRQAFDRALRALPITQHHRIWPLYIKFVCSYECHETAIRVFRRYLKVYHYCKWSKEPRINLWLILQLCPENTEDYIEYLATIGRLDEAAIKLAGIVNNENYVSKHGKSNHQLWNELCELISKNPDKVKYGCRNTLKILLYRVCKKNQVIKCRCDHPRRTTQV